jgi:hypothetical protein
MTRLQYSECVHVTTYWYLYHPSYVEVCRRALNQINK